MEVSCEISQACLVESVPDQLAMILPGRDGLAGGTVIPSGNPQGVLRRDHHAVKRRVIASSLREGKPWLIKTRAEDALQPWSADRL